MNGDRRLLDVSFNVSHALEYYLNFFTCGVVSKKALHYQTVKVKPTINICYHHCKLMLVAQKGRQDVINFAIRNAYFLLQTLDHSQESRYTTMH